MQPPPLSDSRMFSSLLKETWLAVCLLPPRFWQALLCLVSVDLPMPDISHVSDFFHLASASKAHAHCRMYQCFISLYSCVTFHCLGRLHVVCLFIS